MCQKTQHLSVIAPVSQFLDATRYFVLCSKFARGNFLSKLVAHVDSKTLYYGLKLFGFARLVLVSPFGSCHFKMAGA